ncbi:MAG TPA: N-acetyl-gamma-glutamyl-phosphate reductase, partial [bacterium]|nr:N-acetyl-gamma-glutamyl-phosphate reductase [bacterium]
MLKVAVVGATGYTGIEIVKLLLGHPRVEIAALAAKVDGPVRLQDEFPQLRGNVDLTVKSLDVAEVASAADFVFLALPHTISMRFAAAFLKAGKKVVDLSADYRFRDVSVFERWYGAEHVDPEGVEEAVYGMPELFRDEIRSARLVGNPGCYPTGTILGIYPALSAGLVSGKRVIVDAKTGVTGAGRKASLPLLFPEVNENFKAYGLVTHKHTPEMEYILSRACGTGVEVEFSPHLLPVNRGILGTVYLDLIRDVSPEEVEEAYLDAYRGEPFVRVYPRGSLPELREAVGNNTCRLGLTLNPRTRRLIVVTAVDNLLKGAAGQAVQNMNIMEGFDE